MKTRKDSNTKLWNFKIQIPFSGTAVRIERKTTMNKLIRILLGMVVVLTFLGNILFIMETRKLNSDAEKAVDIPMGRRQSVPRNLEDELRRAAELKPAKTTGTTYVYTTFLSCCAGYYFTLHRFLDRYSIQSCTQQRRRFKISNNDLMVHGNLAQLMLTVKCRQFTGRRRESQC